MSVTTSIEALNAPGPKRTAAQRRNGRGANRYNAETALPQADSLWNTSTLTNTTPNMSTPASNHRSNVTFRNQDLLLRKKNNTVGTMVMFAIMFEKSRVN